VAEAGGGDDPVADTFDDPELVERAFEASASCLPGVVEGEDPTTRPMKSGSASTSMLVVAGCPGGHTRSSANSPIFKNYLRLGLDIPAHWKVYQLQETDEAGLRGAVGTKTGRSKECRIERDGIWRRIVVVPP
jgi:hypothetical protein